MIGADQSWLRGRIVAVLAIIIPGFTGIVYLTLAGAPTRFALINLGAITAATLCASFLKMPNGSSAQRLLALGLLVALALPLVAGPSIDGVSRWLSVGGFTLHMGMVVIPLLSVLAALDRKAAPLILLAALMVSFAQPDMASCLALAFAAFALWLSQRDWTTGAIAALAVFASIGASFSGALPPQPFVEGILSDLLQSNAVAAGGLAVSLLASLLIMLTALPSPKASRYALAGAMAGFVTAAIIGDYPYPLIGYGAASILGLGLALIRQTDGRSLRASTLKP